MIETPQPIRQITAAEREQYVLELMQDGLTRDEAEVSVHRFEYGDNQTTIIDGKTYNVV